MGAAGVDPHRAQGFHRRRDHVDLLPPHGAAFSRMRIEPGEGETRRRDAEAIRHIRRDDAAGLDQQLAGQQPGNLGQRDMDRHRHDREFRSPQHHHRPRRDAEITQREFAQKFGMAGMFKSRRVKRLLGNRIGDDRPRLISRDKFHREFDRADRQRRVERVGRARKTIDSPPERNDGQRPRENLDGAGRSRRLHADIEPKRFRNASEQSGIADDEKRRQISGSREREKP